MANVLKRGVLLLLIVALLLPVAGMPVGAVTAEDPMPVAPETPLPAAETMAVDLILVRPLGMASTVLGCALYVVSLPFSLPGGNSTAVWKSAVAKPAGYTFARPLGEFE